MSCKAQTGHAHRVQRKAGLPELSCLGRTTDWWFMSRSCVAGLNFAYSSALIGSSAFERAGHVVK